MRAHVRDDARSVLACGTDGHIYGQQAGFGSVHVFLLVYLVDAAPAADICLWERCSRVRWSHFVGQDLPDHKLCSSCCQAACISIPACPICLVWRPACQGGMRTPRVVVGDPPVEPGSQFRAGLGRMQVDASVFQAAPEPLDEHVVHPLAAPVHGDEHPRVLQHVGETRRGELAALVSIEDAGLPVMGQVLFKSLDAKRSVHGVRHAPCQHLAGGPIHHRDQVEKAATHRDVDGVGAPDLVRALDDQVAQQIGNTRCSGLGTVVRGRW